MTTIFIWSQIIALIGMIISVVAVQIKNARAMRIVMFISALFNGAHFLLLGFPQAGIIEYVTGSRWIVSIFTHRKAIMMFFIIIIMGIGYLHADGIISALPVIGGVLGTLAAFSDNDRRMRVYLIIALLLWVIHNIVVFTPIGILSSLTFLVSLIVGYERFYHHNHVYLFPHQPVHSEKPSQI